MKPEEPRRPAHPEPDSRRGHRVVWVLAAVFVLVSIVGLVLIDHFYGPDHAAMKVIESTGMN